MKSLKALREYTHTHTHTQANGHSIENSNQKCERNYGIDLLRIVSMFYIILLHSLGRGGLLNNTIKNSNQYKLGWFIEICSYGAANIFALISGYVSYTDKEKNVKLSNYIKLWLEVTFYGLAITGIFNIFMPKVVSYKDYIDSVLPVTKKLYWYFTAYTGLFMIMPIINKGIRNCDNKTLKKLFIVIILVFSFWDRLFNGFILSDGYSFIWITLLYILGAIIKKCEIGKHIKLYKIVLSILFFNTITYLYKIYGFDFKILDISITKKIFVSYTSPTILIVSILHIILFSKLKFNSICEKIIKFMAPSAFAIYILNCNKFVWNYIMKDLLKFLAEQSLKKICVYVFGFAFIFVIGSILVDKIRLFLFKICKIDKLADVIEKLLKKIITKVSEFI